MPNLQPNADAPGWWITAAAGQVNIHPIGPDQRLDRFDPRSAKLAAVMGAATVYHDPHRTLLLVDPRKAVRAVIEKAIEIALTGPEPIMVRYHWDDIWSHLSCTRRRLRTVLADLQLATFLAAAPVPKVRELRPGDAPPEFADAIENPMRWRRQMLFFRKGLDGMLRWKSIGPDAAVVSILGPAWAAGVIGSSYDLGFYDSEFDRLTAEAYRRVDQTGQPHVSRITGPLHTPEGIIQQSYTRLIVNVGAQLACLSKLDPSADPPAPYAPACAEPRP